LTELTSRSDLDAAPGSSSRPSSIVNLYAELAPGRKPDWRRTYERPPRVLIVDDTVTNRRLLLAILRRQGYELLEAEDGESALRIARERHPDLLLLDIMMPRKDGYEVCEELKADRETADIPVIFLTAKTQSSDKIRGLELGAVDYITKPFSKGEILARVNTHLEIRLLAESILRMNRELLAKQRRIDADLQAAAAIQRSLIPTEERKRRLPEIDLDWIFLPCNRIGGDVFNVFRLDESHVGAYVLDVSGHGVPSAMVTVSVSQSLDPHDGSILRDRLDSPPGYRLPGPAEVCRRLDREFPFERFGKFFTFAYFLIDIRTGLARYTRAAHPHPVLVRGDGSARRLETGGTIIGLDDGRTYEEGEVRLSPGDRIYLYTDGVLEQANGSGERFGDERLRGILTGERRPLRATCEGVVEAVKRFAGRIAAEDDITFVGLEYRGPRESAPTAEDPSG
jgi:sigma-B regulation protein RsbU (phosphoserine phosphatase)